MVVLVFVVVVVIEPLVPRGQIDDDEDEDESGIQLKASVAYEFAIPHY